MAGLKEFAGLGGPQLAGLFAVAVLTLCIWRRYLSPISDIPGPFAASFTRLWHIHRILKGDQNLELIRLHNQHGHFVRVAPNEVSVSHPDAVRKILGTMLHKDKWYKIIAFPDGRFENPMSATDPKVKLELSKHLAPAYTLSNLLINEPSVSETIKLLLGWLDKFASSGEPIDLGKYFTFATSDIVGDAVFSKQFGFLREGRDINNTIANATPQTAYHPDRMKLHEIHSAAFNAVAAGNETVSSGLQAFVYYMIRHPNAWDRARAEIDAAGLKDPVISYMDAQKLPFLQACIKETLRIFGPAPMGLPRIAPEGGLTIGDRTIPQGTVVSVSIWVMHYSKEIWGPDAGEFNPDRWLGEDAARLTKYYIPWGMGYASCPGQHLARIELYKICAALVRDYNIRQVDPKQEWTWKAYFTVVPHNWPCIVEKRNKETTP
ncbi:benzoate 4-monooxygenase cytochrome P450 [Histoplasma capsulatum H143]|uniref:Benzoate 4-monooxygenase cytochrome P450 n=1 Tax=Ajellomyces capsulatus (strain H143) TaxID=544712 RepID=C6HHL8_AJECH|nr:benzoate 4-monooxygenase cytochrome P450 [Histoplasma capsulatum H143]